MKKGLSIILVGLLCFSAFSIFVPKARATETTIFSDDFENYAVGTFPSAGGWKLIYNGAGDQYQVITSSYAASGNKSLQMEGQYGWSAVVAKDFSSSSNLIGFEAYVMGTPTSGPSVGFGNETITTWGIMYGGVTVDTNAGYIVAESHNLQPCTANTWYKIREVMDRNARTFDVWINDQLEGINIPEANNPWDIRSLRFDVGWHNVLSYYDDVKVFEESPSPTYSVFFEESGVSNPAQVWGVSLAGYGTEYSNGPGNNISTVTFTGVANGGPYQFTVTPPSGFVAKPTSGFITVNGSYFHQPITFNPATETTIFSDDFDSYAVGTFPSSGGWQIVWNGLGDQYQVVTNSYCHSQPNSLQLVGSDGWSVVVKKDFSSSSNVIGYEGYVMTADYGNPQYGTAGIGFFNQYIATWGRYYAGVGFSNGSIWANSGGTPVKLQAYTAGTWYKVRTVLNKSSGVYNVWIDDIPVGANLVESNNANEIQSLQLSEGWSSTYCYFDDVSVFSVSVVATSLNIYVKDAAGNPIAGATVVSTSQPSGQAPLSGTTDNTGLVAFTGILNGSYTIKCSKNGYKNETWTLTVPAGQIKTETVTLSKLAGASALPLMWVAIVVILVAVITVGAVFAIRKTRTPTKGMRQTLPKTSAQ
jgi:hypothetical protein